MKILQIYYEPLPSGQTAHVLLLSKGLVTRGHEVTVILPEVLKALSREYEKGGVDVISIPMRKIYWPLRSMAGYLNLLRNKKYDIVHVHSQEAGMTARWLTWLGGSCCIFYTPQTIDIRQRQWHPLYVLLECILARITNRIFSVNQADASRMIRWGIPAEKVSVVPNGIELNQFENLEDRVNICRRLGLDPDRPVVMQVGRLSPQKDPEMFLKGAGYVLSSLSEVQLVWIGEGPLYAQVKSTVESSRLQDSIRLVGRIDQAYHCLAAADVVTLTSRWEGLPYSILEAMACSKPVVSTAVNGCPEVVLNGETGYLVDTGDAAGWANRVLHLIANPQLARSMGLAGRHRVEEKYTLSLILSEIEQAYFEIIMAKK